MRNEVQDIQVLNRVREYLTVAGYSEKERQVLSMRVKKESFSEIEKELGIKEEEAVKILFRMEETMKKYAERVKNMFEAIEGDDSDNIAMIDGLNTRAINSLRRLGIFTIEDLRNMSEEDINRAKIRGLGVKTKFIIREAKKRL